MRRSGAKSELSEFCALLQAQRKQLLHELRAI
jgi:hypothetical protein